MVTSVPAANPTQLSVVERMARLLGVVPWVVEQGGAHLDEIADRFDYPRDQLLEDLEQRLFFVGVHPFTPDTLINVFIEDGIVDIQYAADWFSRPMQLSGEEATRLLAAGRTVLDMAQAGGPGEGVDDDEANPLVRALAKLTLSMGSGGEGGVEHIDVCLGHAPSDTLGELRRAISLRRRIEIEYYSFGRDVMTSRAVDPVRLLSRDGVWYLFGWCHRAGAERVFRVERIRTLAVTDTPIEVQLDMGEEPVLGMADIDRTVTVRLAPEAAWAADYHDARQRTERPDGAVDAVFAVASESWLARVLVQLGPQAELTACDPGIDPGLRAATAGRMLERYRR